MTDIETMQEFFKSELKTLAIKTGIDQVEYICKSIESKEEAIKAINEVTLMWAKVSCESPFDKINTDAKKRIIQDQMIKDESFVKPSYGQLPGFNNRIIWKWMNNHWMMHGNIIEKKEESNTEIAPPEIADKYLNQLKEQLSSGFQKPVYKNLEKEMEAITTEDEERVNGRKASIREANEKAIELSERKMEAIKKRGLDKIGLDQIKRFKIDGVLIFARNVEEAQEIYLEVY